MYETGRISTVLNRHTFTSRQSFLQLLFINDTTYRSNSTYDSLNRIQKPVWHLFSSLPIYHESSIVWEIIASATIASPAIWQVVINWRNPRNLTHSKARWEDVGRIHSPWLSMHLARLHYVFWVHREKVSGTDVCMRACEACKLNFKVKSF